MSCHVPEATSCPFFSEIVADAFELYEPLWDTTDQVCPETVPSSV